MASILIAVVPAVLIFCALYLTLLLVKVIQEDQGKLPRRNSYSPAKVSAKPKARPSVKRRARTRVNSCLQNQLMGMVANDQELADRLVASNRRKFSGRSEDWYWEKTICDLERDRR
jgi:hypothetical protein